MNDLSRHLADLRQQYSMKELNEECVDASPFQQFREWFSEAENSAIKEPNIMSLATSNAQGCPSLRIVLLKGLDERGFTFFTNYDSRKGHDMTENPHAALCFLWLPLERQVRVEGRVEKISPEESDSYYNIRPKGSRIGAWASPQSRRISKEALQQRIRMEEEKYSNTDEIPRPDNWGGFRVIPDMIEFWQGRPNRLHDRIAYFRQGDNWEIARLAP